MESDKKIKLEKEEKVKVFLDKLSTIDGELQKLVSNFNNGLEELSSLKFENNVAENRLNSRGFTIGPAYTTINQNKNGFSLIKLEEDPHYYEEMEVLKDMMIENDINDDFLETKSLEDFKKQFEGKNSKSLNGKDSLLEAKQVSEDEIFNRFGMLNVPNRLYLVKKNFEKTLDNIINIANVLQSLK